MNSTLTMFLHIIYSAICDQS